MRRFSPWVRSIVTEIRTALKKEGYGELVMAVVLCAILSASLGLVATSRWEFTLLLAVVSIPGSLLVGVQSVLSRHRHPEVQRLSRRKVISRFLVVLVWMCAVVGSARLTHVVVGGSPIVSFVVFVTIVAPGILVITGIARRVSRRRQSTVGEKRGK